MDVSFMGKKVLIIGYCNAYFRREFVRNVVHEQIQYDVLSFEKCDEKYRNLYNRVYTCASPFKGKIQALMTYILFFIHILTVGHYDIIHIHSIKEIESLYAPLIRKKCDKLICTIYGSDYMRVTNKVRQQYKKLFDRADYITLATKTITQDFNQYYKNRYLDKIVRLSMAIDTFRVIDQVIQSGSNREELKSLFGIPRDSFVITVGYNATREQNHTKIFKQLMESKEWLPSNYFVVVPMGYGNAAYRERIVEEFNHSGLNGKCLCEFYDMEMIARLRLSSEMMIQLQDTDLISASMMEYIYTGNIVVTGAWLNYTELNEYIEEICSIEALSSKLKEIFSDLEQYCTKTRTEKCKKYLNDNFSWLEVKKKWLMLYGVE
ncbi:hypothetical protein B5G37_09730 [Pseudoflavonifractor sp. An85]|nr:hypothetical protein B5G37_09730 [Pseudoflavonifractor sp. An85]